MDCNCIGQQADSSSYVSIIETFIFEKITYFVRLKESETEDKGITSKSDFPHTLLLKVVGLKK